MKYDEFLNQVLLSQQMSVAPVEIIIGLILAFVLTFAPVYVYRRTRPSSNYSVSFLNSLFLFSVLTSGITMIIGSNFARAFGLIGIFSIVRFRTALKSPVDAVYTFWALTIGMACGTGNYLGALLIVLMTSCFGLFLHWINFAKKRYVDSIYNISVESAALNEVDLKIENILKKMCVSYNQVNRIIDSNKDVQSFIYYTKQKANIDEADLLTQLRTIESVSDVRQTSSDSPQFYVY